MAEYENNDNILDNQEEATERTGREALRQTMRTEIRRTHTGERNTEREDASTEDSAEATAEKAPKRKKGLWSKIEVFLTGDILLAEEANRFYNLLALLCVIFLASIFLMFGSFQRDLHCSKLRTEVDLLKEKAIRTSEECTNNSSHSAILNKLKERGIDLGDPTTTPIVLK